MTPKGTTEDEKNVSETKQRCASTTYRLGSHQKSSIALNRDRGCALRVVLLIIRSGLVTAPGNEGGVVTGDSDGKGGGWWGLL